MKSWKRLHQILLPYRKKIVYIRYAHERKRTRRIKRGSGTTKQREPDNETKKSDNETKKPDRGERESRTTEQRIRTTKQREPDRGARELNTH